MKELTNEQLEKLKKADTSELVQIMADAVKQAGENLQNLSPTELEEDLKSVALLLNRQGNADKLINAANNGSEQNFGAILQELIPIVGNDKTDLNAVTPSKKEKSKLKNRQFTGSSSGLSFVLSKRRYQ